MQGETCVISDKLINSNFPPIKAWSGIKQAKIISLTSFFGSAAYNFVNNVTLPDRSEVVKAFTPQAWRDPPSVEECPRHARWFPTLEVVPDTRGGKTFATEQEGGVMSLFYDLRPRSIFWVYQRVIAFRPGMRSGAERHEAK